EKSEFSIYIEPLKCNSTSINNFKKLINFLQITVKDLEGKEIEPEREGTSILKVFSRSSLRGIITIGVETIPFRNEDSINAFKYIEPLSKEYMITRKSPERIDKILGPALNVKFNVQNHPLFANSKVLSMFSPYWKDRLNEQREDKKSSFTGEREHDAKESFRHVYKEFDVEEHDYLIILHMIQVAYTGDITIGKKRDAYRDLLILADRYRIPVLRIIGVNIENAAKLYFGYSCSQLKGYIINNFDEIVKTKSYDEILKNHEKYPTFLDMYEDILVELCSSEL
ncbi:12540_t:CDS:2, partial [Acaulospora colombiana]